MHNGFKKTNTVSAGEEHSDPLKQKYSPLEAVLSTQPTSLPR